MLNKLMLNSQNGKAVVLMVLAVLGYSGMPLFVSWGEGTEAPFIFTAAWKIGLAAGCVVFLLTFYPSLVFSKNVWKLAWQRVVSLPMAIWAITHLNIYMYALSTQSMDVSITAVLYETWPIAFLFIAWGPFGHEGRYRLIIALVGVVGRYCQSSSRAKRFGLRWVNYVARSCFWSLLGFECRILCGDECYFRF